MPFCQLEQRPYLFEFKNSERNIQTDIIFLNKIIKRMMLGFSPIICICGAQRSGKSFIGVWLSYIIMKAFGKVPNWDRNCVYDPKQTATKLIDLNEETFMLDEASSSFHKREWYKRINIAFNKIIITQGRKAICPIFISPFVNDIDKAFIKHFDFVIRVKYRGSIKAYLVKKKYDALIETKSTYLRHQDDVYVKMKDVPTKLWMSYKEFSDKEKDKIEMDISMHMEGKAKKKTNDMDIKEILKGF